MSTARFWGGICLSALCGTTAIAADTDTTQIIKSLDEAPKFLSSQQPVFQAGPAPKAMPKSDLHMTVEHVMLDGHEITDPALETIIAPYLNKDLSFQELSKMTAEMTAHYRGQGYMLNQVILPAQEGAARTLNLHLVEGYVDNVEVKGDEWLMEGRIHDYVQRILNARPITQGIFERNILLLDDLPGVEVKATLVRSKTNSEASTLILELHQKYVNLATTLNNEGTKSIGPWQGQISTSFNNVMGNNEAFTFGLSAAPANNGMKVFNVGFKQPLGSDGWMLNLSGSTSRTHPSGTLSDLRNYGESDTFVVNLNYHLVRMKFKSLMAGVSLNISNNRNDTRLTGAVTKDRLRVFSAHMQYDFSDQWQGQNILNVTAFKGINGMGSTASSSLTKSRNTGKIDFFKTTFLAIRTQILPYNFQLQGVIQAQWAANSLVSSQRFIIGGPPYNRTYPNATFSGDSGIEYKIELSHVLRDVPLVQYIMPYFYYSHGAVWNKAREAGEKKKQSISGMSIGMRSGITDNLNAFVEYSFPFKHRIDKTNYNNKTYVGLSYNMSF